MKFNLKQFAQAVQLLGPAVLQLAGVPPAFSGLVVHGITVAEGIKGASGAEKKARVLDLVKTSAAATDMVVHPDLNDVDEDQLATTVGHGIDAVIEAVKVVKNIPVRPIAA